MFQQTAQQAEEDDVEVGTSPKHVIQTVVGEWVADWGQIHLF